MFFSKRSKVIALNLALTVFMTGCSLPFFCKESRVSPDKVAAACEEYDAEGYDDLEDLTGDLDNKRSLVSGMYIKADGKNVRHTLNDSDINGAFSDVSGDLMKELYSKSIETMTLLVKRVESGDYGEVVIIAMSASFGSEDDAWKYYKNCNKAFEEKAGSNDECEMDYLSDDDLECTVTQICSRRSAVSYSVYIDRSCVMVLTGYEYRCNDAGDELAEFCSQLDIPEPDMSDWDCTVQAEVDDRLLLLRDEYDFTDMDPETFDDNFDIDVSAGCYYTETADTYDMEDIISLDEDYFTNVSLMRAAYIINGSPDYDRGGDYNAVCVVSFHCSDDQSAADFYNDLTTYFIEDNEDEIIDSDSDSDGIITYTKMDVDDFLPTVYGVYLENDSVYLAGLIAVDGQMNQNNYRNVLTGIMGLP